MILYNCKNSIERENSFVVTKFDDDMNIESSYTTSLSECDCPAGVRPTCRHRQMLPHFMAARKVDSEWFFCYDNQSWHKPWEGMEPNEDETHDEGERNIVEGNDSIERALETEASSDVVEMEPELIVRDLPAPALKRRV